MLGFKEGKVVFHQGDQVFCVSDVPAYIEDILPDAPDVQDIMLKPFDSASLAAEILDFDPLLLKMMMVYLPSRLKHLACHHSKARVRKKNRARLLKM